MAPANPGTTRIDRGHTLHVSIRTFQPVRFRFAKQHFHATIFTLCKVLEGISQHQSFGPAVGRIGQRETGVRTVQVEILKQDELLAELFLAEH